MLRLLPRNFLRILIFSRIMEIFCTTLVIDGWNYLWLWCHRNFFTDKFEKKKGGEGISAQLINRKTTGYLDFVCTGSDVVNRHARSNREDVGALLTPPPPFSGPFFRGCGYVAEISGAGVVFRGIEEKGIDFKDHRKFSGSGFELYRKIENFLFASRRFLPLTKLKH